MAGRLNIPKTIPWLLPVLFLSIHGGSARAECNKNVKAPQHVAKAGTAVGTSEQAGTVLIGPGGPFYARVKNTSDVGASFGLAVRKKGGTLLHAFCNIAAVISPDEESWLEVKNAGDDFERNVDVFTGVQGTSLELTVFKNPNLLPTTLSETITIRLRAFIPNVHPTNPSFGLPVPNKPEWRMIPGPLPQFVQILPVDSIKAAADCYLTDNRGFSSEAMAQSKVRTEFRIVINHGQISINPDEARLAHRAGASSRLNCTSGEVIAEKPGTFDGVFGVRALGQPAAADNKVQIIGQAAIGNPHIVGAPMIDYAFDLTYDSTTKQLAYSITLGNFPAFEMYAFRGSKAPVTVFQVPPVAESAWGLTDGGVGLNIRTLSGKVQL
jgi:hypothetical protein